MSNLTPSSEYRETKAAWSKSWGSPLKTAAVAMRPQSRVMTTHLELAERIELQPGLRAGNTQAVWTSRLNRSAGALSQQLKRNGAGNAGAANAKTAASVAPAQGHRSFFGLASSARLLPGNARRMSPQNLRFEISGSVLSRAYIKNYLGSAPNFPHEKT